MDHLPSGRSGGGASHMVVPFVTDFNFDGQDFFAFPERCGFDKARLESVSVASLASLAQSWFYFGLIDVFFNRHVDPLTFREDHGDGDGTGEGQGPRVVSAGPLCSLLDRWLADVVIPVLNPPPTADLAEIEPLKLFDYRDETLQFLEDVLETLGTFEELPQASHAPLPVILLSAKVLIGTLSGVLNEAITFGKDLLTLGYADREWYSQRHVPLRPGANGDENRPIPPTTQLLLREFEAQGCCPLVSRQLCETYNYAAVYYATRIGITSKASHDRCTARECVANNVDMKNYTTRHASLDCDCSHMSVPVEEVRAIIAAGGIPLIRVEGPHADGTITVRAKRMTSSTPYVAFSHVWSDGLGNPTANALPRCQLTRLQRNVEDLKQPRVNFNMGIVNLGWVQWDAVRMTNDISLGWFWLDTLCIPVGDAYMDLKVKAINQMAAIYAGASQVLILDSGVEQFQPKWNAAADSCEILFKVCTTAWMRRCWTFQEAAIGVKCQIQCQGEAVDPLEIPVGLLSEMQWAFFTSDSLTVMLRRCARMIQTYYRNFSHIPTLRYRSMRVDRDSRSIVAAVVSRPFHNVLLDHFQGRKTETARFDAADAETLYREFVRCWNTLNQRTTTMWDDIPIILANLLDFNAFEILRLTDPAERMKSLLWSVPALPFSLFFNSEAPRHDPGGHHRNRWLPLYPRQNSVRAEPRVLVEGSNLELSGVPFSEESKKEAVPIEERLWSTASLEGPQELCTVILDQRAAYDAGTRRFEVQKADGLESFHVDVTFLREANDTFASSLGAGKAALVLDQDVTKISRGFVVRGALFQILDRSPEAEKGLDGRGSPSSTPTPTPPSEALQLEVVFDCPVTVQKAQDSTAGPSPSGGAEDIAGEVSGTIVDQSLCMKILGDPPSVSYPLRRRTMRPHPAALFGISYLFGLPAWFLDLAATAVLISICAQHFDTFTPFSKAIAVLRFIFDVLVVIGLSRLQFLSVWLFLTWEMLPISIVLLYLASRLEGEAGGGLFRAEYAFVAMSLASNVMQLLIKMAAKWLFHPIMMDSWMLTFEPDWVPKGFRERVLRFLDRPG